MKHIIRIIIAIGLLAVGGMVVMRAIYPKNYTEYVEEYCSEYSVDQNLVYAVIDCESGYNKDAVSDVGAIGLMQLTPDTFEWVQSKLGEELETEDLYDPQTNIRYGVYLLRLHLDEFGDVQTAIAAYHAGRGKVNDWLNDEEISKDGKTLTSDVPYGDTNAYIGKVMNTIKMYDIIY